MRIRIRGNPTQKSITMHRRLIRLRACWCILRGGSVVCRVNLKDDGALEFLSGYGWSVDCQVNGEHLEWQHLEFTNPNSQPE